MLMIMPFLTIIIIMDVHYLGLIFKVIHQSSDFKQIHLFSTLKLVLHDYYYLDLLILEDPQLSRLIPSTNSFFALNDH